MAIIQRPVQLQQLSGGPNFGQAVKAGLAGLQMGQQLGQRAQQQQQQQQLFDQQQAQFEQQQATRALQGQAIAGEQLLGAQSLAEAQAAISPLVDANPEAAALLEGLQGGQITLDQAKQTASQALQGANAMGIFTPMQMRQQQQQEAEASQRQKRYAGLEKAEESLRKEFLNLAGKSLLEGRDQITKIREAKKTGIGDVSLMKTINKMIDSGIVTDSDFDQVAQSSGLAETFKGMKNKILGGGSLGEEARQQILEQAELLWSAKVRGAQDLASGIDEDAAQKGIERSVIPKAFKSIFARETEQAKPSRSEKFTAPSGLEIEVL